ncbi:hypothetical protein SOVF_166450, partial [Spinacia oleracea]
ISLLPILPQRRPFAQRSSLTDRRHRRPSHRPQVPHGPTVIAPRAHYEKLKGEACGVATLSW